MIDLKDLGNTAREVSERRTRNGAFGGELGTSGAIKHMAGEVVEVAEAFADLTNDEVLESDTAQSFLRLEDELADVVLCAMVVASREGADLERAIYRVLERNVRRADGRGDKA